MTSSKSERDRYALAGDEELVVLHLTGDTEAFNAIIRRYTPRIYNLIQRNIALAAEAENLTQETFLRALRALPRFRGHNDLSLGPWLFRIAINLCRDWGRTRKTIPFAQFATDGDSDESLVEGVPDEEPGALEMLEQEELRDTLREAVMALPEKYRVPITLYYNEGLTYEEIAAVLNLPINTVRTHLLRGKERLRHVLIEYFKEEK